MKIKQTRNLVASCCILFQPGSLYVYTTISVPMPCLWLHVIISQILFKYQNYVSQCIVKAAYTSAVCFYNEHSTYVR